MRTRYWLLVAKHLVVTF